MVYSPALKNTDYSIAYVKNFIPTMANLAKRRHCNNTICPRCQGEVETIEHVFWFCPSAI